MKIPIKRFIKNAFIYISGQNPAKEFFIIKSGEIRITRTNPILGVSEDVRTTGYIFGIIQCLTGIPEEETALALTDCEVFVIEKTKIEDIFINHKKVILKIISEYSEILRKLDRDLTNYEFFPDSERRIEKIFEVASKFINDQEYKKAAHLVLSLQKENPEDKDIQIRCNSILKKLPKVEFYDNQSLITDIVIPPDTVIFTEFELSNCFFIIKKGRVKITKLMHDKEILLAILGDGDIFGEMSILNDKPRNATAVTIDATDLMIIDKKGIDKLPPPLFAKALEFLSKRIWLVQQQLICYKLPLVVSKLYYMLTSKIIQVIKTPDEEEYKSSFLFKFPLKELFQMIDYDYNEDNKKEIEEFLNDKNIDFLSDAIRIKNIKELFDKNAYYFSRSLMIYNSKSDLL
jgi:CRP-like cAMP-binding protein